VRFNAFGADIQIYSHFQMISALGASVSLAPGTKSTVCVAHGFLPSDSASSDDEEVWPAMPMEIIVHVEPRAIWECEPLPSLRPSALFISPTGCMPARATASRTPQRTQRSKVHSFTQLPRIHTQQHRRPSTPAAGGDALARHKSCVRTRTTRTLWHGPFEGFLTQQRSGLLWKRGPKTRV